MSPKISKNDLNHVKRSNTSTDMENYHPERPLQKKRTTNFRDDETKLLISLWGSPVIQNKLYLTHRKAPVMRLLAANMQQRGFYRSPDEIKTRIRNLKCLYHRIKRTMVSGSGLGTVDPDWPHFKAMDAILGKENGQKQNKAIMMKDDQGLEGPRCEDIKQEIDLDIKDDVDSWAGNDSAGCSDFEEHHIPAVTISKTSSMSVSAEISTPSIYTPSMPMQVPTILPKIAVPTTNQMRTNGTIPLPLLILNHGIQPQPKMQDKKSMDNNYSSDNLMFDHNKIPSDLNNILRQILNIQKQQFELDKQKFELEKQRLDFDRVVGTQLMTLVPMVGGLLQRLVYPVVTQHNLTPSETSLNENEAEPKSYTEKPVSDYDILKDSKILRTVLERGIKKYMMADDQDSNKDNEDDSDNDDSGINESNNLLIDNDNSNSSNK